MNKRVEKMVILGIRQFGDPYYQGFAAQIAFYIMLSLVPTIIIVSQVLGILDISLDFLNNWLDQYVTTNMAEALKVVLDNRSTTGNNIMLFIMALWSASRAQFSLMRIANYTYSGGRATGNFFKERWRSVKTMFLTVFTLAFVVIILVYGKDIMIVLFGRMIESSMLITLWSALRWPLAAVLYFLVVLYDYYVLPVEKINIRDIVPGTLVAAIGMVMVTFFYSVYANYIANFGLIYGSLTTIVALLFWFYFLSWVLVIGILFNKVYMDTK